MRTILIAAACGLLAMTATAADPVPAAPPAAEAATPGALSKEEAQASRAAARKAKDDAKVICRRDHEVGSRLANKVCKTKAEWREADKAAGEAWDRARLQMMGRTPPGPREPLQAPNQ